MSSRITCGLTSSSSANAASPCGAVVTAYPSLSSTISSISRIVGRRRRPGAVGHQSCVGHPLNGNRALDRDLDDEAAPPAAGGLGDQPAAVLADDLLTQEEAEPQPRTVTVPVRLEEALEDPRLLARRNADPVVADRDPRAIRSSGSP